MRPPTISRRVGARPDRHPGPGAARRRRTGATAARARGRALRQLRQARRPRPPACSTSSGLAQTARRSAGRGRRSAHPRRRARRPAGRGPLPAGHLPARAAASAPTRNGRSNAPSRSPRRLVAGPRAARRALRRGRQPHRPDSPARTRCSTPIRAPAARLRSPRPTPTPTRPTRAVRLLGHAIERYPDHAETYVALGRLWFEEARGGGSHRARQSPRGPAARRVDGAHRQGARPARRSATGQRLSHPGRDHAASGDRKAAGRSQRRSCTLPTRRNAPGIQPRPEPRCSTTTRSAPRPIAGSRTSPSGSPICRCASTTPPRRRSGTPLRPASPRLPGAAGDRPGATAATRRGRRGRDARPGAGEGSGQRPGKSPAGEYAIATTAACHAAFGGLRPSAARTTTRRYDDTT